MLTWPADDPRVVQLPSGRSVRARALRRPSPLGSHPDFGLYLAGRRPPEVPWPLRWVRWGDFRLPPDQADAREALVEAWQRAKAERVEVACGGGRGRTGTALACLAVLDGVPPDRAVTRVRRTYDPRTVETARQRRWISRFPNIWPRPAAHPL